MATPTLTKTWEISPDYAYSYPKGDSMGVANYRNFWLQFIAYLKSKSWTVRSASNQTTASTSTDWTQGTDIKWSNNPGMLNGARSWIVLRNTNVVSTQTFDLCIDMSTGSGYSEAQQFQMFVAPGGYSTTSLVTTARPAAINNDEVMINDSSYFAGGGVLGYRADVAWRMHCWCSSDRKSTRIMIYTGDNLTGIFMIETPQYPTTGWSDPWFAMFRTGGGGAVTTQTGWSSAVASSRFSNTNVGLYLSCESITGQSSLLSQPNDISREYPMLPIGLLSTTAPYRGHHGYIYDAWWTIQASNGLLIPNATSKLFSLHGGMVLPWDGISLVKTR